MTLGGWSRDEDVVMSTEDEDAGDILASEDHDAAASMGTLPVSELERLREYAVSEIPLKRIIVARDIGSIVKCLQFTEVLTYLVPHLMTLAGDQEPTVRQILVENISKLASYLCQREEEAGYATLVSSVLPVIKILLRDTANQQVREKAAVALTQVAAMLKPDDLEDFVLKLIKAMADSEDADQRMAVPGLISELAATLGDEICRESLVPEMDKLAKDPMFRVRKAVAMNLGGLCAVVGAEHTQAYLIPAYMGLAQDEIWGVRKACTESIVSIAKACTPEFVGSTIIGLFTKFTEDTSRWVKNNAFQQLGPFLSCLSTHQISPSLLTLFTTMGNSFRSDDSEMYLHCAFSFPAVSLTVGRERWSELSATYLSLARDVQWKVRRTLSHSLHEMAKILGPELSVTQLVPVADLFLKDLDEVKVGVVRNLGDFLLSLPLSSRERYLVVLSDLLNEGDSWRFRRLLSLQLGSLSLSFGREQFKGVILGIAMSLCTDRVGKVREAAHRSMSAVLKACIANDCAKDLCDLMMELKGDRSYGKRQVFACMAREMFASPLLALPQAARDVDALLCEGVMSLADDPVPNVRIAVALALRERREIAEKVLQKLRRDPDPDVSFYAADGAPDYVPTPDAA